MEAVRGMGQCEIAFKGQSYALAHCKSKAWPSLKLILCRCGRRKRVACDMDMSKTETLAPT